MTNKNIILVTLVILAIGFIGLLYYFWGWLGIGIFLYGLGGIVFSSMVVYFSDPTNITEGKVDTAQLLSEFRIKGKLNRIILKTGTILAAISFGAIWPLSIFLIKRSLYLELQKFPYLKNYDENNKLYYHHSAINSAITLSSSITNLEWVSLIYSIIAVVTFSIFHSPKVLLFLMIPIYLHLLAYFLVTICGGRKNLYLSILVSIKNPQTEAIKLLIAITALTAVALFSMNIISISAIDLEAAYKNMLLIVQFKFLKAIIDPDQTPLYVKMQSLFYLLYSITFLASIQSIFTLKRNDEHLIAIASNLIKMGRYDEALSFLQKVEAKSYLYYLNRTWAFAGLGKFDKALESVEKAQRMRFSESGFKFEQWSNFTWLFMELLANKIPKTKFNELIELWFKNNPKDFELAKYVVTRLSLNNKIHVNDPQLIFDQISEDVEKYPLTISIVHQLTEDYESSIEALEQFQPSTNNEICFKFLLSFDNICLYQLPNELINENQINLILMSFVQFLKSSIPNDDHSFDYLSISNVINLQYEFYQKYLSASQFEELKLLIDDILDKARDQQPEAKRILEIMENKTTRDDFLNKLSGFKLSNNT